MKASDKLSKILKYLKISANKFSIEIGLENNTGIYHLKKDRNDISPDMANTIIKRYPEFNYDWLLTGRGEMLLSAENEEIKGTVSLQPSIGRPFYDVDFTLGFSEVDNDITLHPEFNIDFPPANREGVNWFRGKGNSMLGEINSGDYIALEEVLDFSWFPLGRIYGIVTKNGFRTIKRVVQSETNKDEYVLISSNEDKINYPDQALPKNMIHKLYKVIFVIQDLDE